MNAIATLVAAAIIVEALVQVIKMAKGDVAIDWEIIAAAVIGIALAVAYGLDLMAVLGYDARLPYIGEVLTGLLFGRGANGFFDLVGRLSEGR